MHMAAVALTLDLGASDQPVIAGYDVYRPANAMLNAAQVREELEEHLIANGLIEENVAPLAVHLLLAKTAPEILMQKAPADLTLNKPGWVVIAQTVAVLEDTAPGMSRLMSYQEIKAFSDLTAVTQEQAELLEITGVVPVINWAVLNNVIPYQIGKDYDSASLTKASSYFQWYMDALHQSETGLSTLPPDRRKLALEALKKVMPNGDYLQRQSLHYSYENSYAERSWLDYFRFFNPSGVISETYDLSVSKTGHSEYALSRLLRMRFSILDLHLSGDLIENGKLTARFLAKNDLNAPPNAFARVAELEPVDKLFDDAFDNYFRKAQESLSSVIKMAITSLPERDRHALTNGNMTFYTVRKEVNILNPREETQVDRNAAKGRKRPLRHHSLLRKRRSNPLL